jgi:hypothetical protein
MACQPEGRPTERAARSGQVRLWVGGPAGVALEPCLEEEVVLEDLECLEDFWVRASVWRQSPCNRASQGVTGEECSVPATLNKEQKKGWRRRSWRTFGCRPAFGASHPATRSELSVHLKKSV